MAIRDRLSHWTPEPGDAPPVRAQTTGDLLDEAVQRWPHREAIVYSGYRDDGLDVRWSYRELREHARDVARALVAAGMAKGDRVAVWATNLPQWVALQFGAATVGVVIVPLNPLYRTKESAYVLEKSAARMLFVEPYDRGSSLWEMAFDAQRSAPALERIVAVGDAPDDRGPSWKAWLQGGGDVSEATLHRRSAEVTPADLAQIQFTSGTTGFPKGAALPHLGLVNNPRLMAHRAGWGVGTRLCSALPFFHTGGSVQSTLGIVGSGGTFMPMLTFDPRRMVDTIGAEQVEAVIAVPTMLFALERELDAGGGTFDSLRTVIVGGAPVPEELCLRWQERFGVRFSIVYGLTEASPIITQSLPSDPIDRQVGTCGFAMEHVEWDVADPGTGLPVALGEHGEVRVRGWSVMRGYHGDADATAAALTRDGWLRTGDLGTMDADGYLRITGRAKEMVIRGGENIYPAEIEAALRDLEGVAEAYVVGVPDDHYGEVCAAFVRLRPGAELTEEAMGQQLSERVARYKVPQYLRVVEDFPLTASGKVQKFKLRERFLQTPV